MAVAALAPTATARSRSATASDSVVVGVPDREHTGLKRMKKPPRKRESSRSGTKRRPARTSRTARPVGVPDREPALGAAAIAAFVRERRKANGLTQRDLGLLAGVGKRFVVELEAGKPTLRLDRVERVLAVFGKRVGPVDVERGGS